MIREIGSSKYWNGHKWTHHPATAKHYEAVIDALNDCRNNQLTEVELVLQIFAQPSEYDIRMRLDP
jgi:hypothetical protein